MGAGIRPKGSFPYAALRYPECRKKVPCFGNPKKCPDNDLCGTSCVHFEDCQKESDSKVGGALT